MKGFLIVASKQESANVKSHLKCNNQLSIYYSVVVNDSLILIVYNNDLFLIQVNVPAAAIYGLLKLVRVGCTSTFHVSSF